MKAVIKKEPQYITDKKGKKLSVVISLTQYKQILDNLEELDDIKLYDPVKNRKEKSIPFNQHLQSRRKKHA
ncbi:MAG: hypothetical protein SGI83_01575 [Bacteroidota bacterium]|nr:hypothetical protein [Bacteroidota bacterium]